jgi:flagellar protein FlaF
MSETSINAYQQQLKTTETPQETEAAVLERAAYALETAQRNPKDLSLLEDALRYNQLVWTSIQSVLDNDNAMPDQLVANLMSLSIFIDRQHAKALYDEDRNHLTAIININRNIAAGLRDAARLAMDQAAKETAAPDATTKTQNASQEAPASSLSGFKPTEA